MKPLTTLAVASNGGHWHQMQQIVPAFEGAQGIFASTGVLGASTASGEGFHADVRLTDYNQNEMRKAFRGLVEAVRMICKVKLSIVISTGAAPGPLMCLSLIHI